MSFDLAIPDILQYAYNVFASALPLVYLFVGAGFGIFVLSKVYNMVRS